MARNQENLYQIEGSCARKPRTEVVGSKSYNLAEFHSTITDQEIKTGMVAYLEEYRLKKKKHDYTLIFSKGEEGFRLRDQQREESMRTKAILAIQEKKIMGDPTQREEAELRGIVKFEDQLRFAKDGDHIFWASPPGPKEDGYGDYGFLFAGRVKKGQEKTAIEMTAYRVEKPNIEMFNNALTRLTGKKIEYADAKEFLEDPRLVKREDLNISVNELLQSFFAFNEDENEQNITKQITSELEAMIDEFVKIARTGKNDEKIKSFNALENYTLELRERYQHTGNAKIIYLNRHIPPRLLDIIGSYGHEAPVVGGSCGSTKQKSNNIFNSIENVTERVQKILRGEIDSEDWFKCPKCNYKADGPVGDKCPGCGLTKEDYVKSGGQTC